MDLADLVALIKGAVSGAGPRWADLGAGEGAFTLALADLLGPGAQLTAVDRDRRALERFTESMGMTFPQVQSEVVVADFTRPLTLRNLDGVLMANSLHFLRDKAPVLGAVREMLKPDGRLVVVEYSGDRGNLWVPHPFTFETWKRMAEQAGFVGTALSGTVPSRYYGSMYCALSLSPATPGGGLG